MTDQQKIDQLRSALGALLSDLEWHGGRFLSPAGMVSALVNPQTLQRCDEAMDTTKPNTGVQKEGSVRSAYEEQHKS